MEKVLDKNGKVDKGFELVYWNLSYRRKFVRTLWLIPVIIAVIIMFIVLDNVLNTKSHVITILVALVLVVTEVIQLIYTYKKWKAEE